MVQTIIAIAAGYILLCIACVDILYRMAQRSKVLHWHD